MANFTLIWPFGAPYKGILTAANMTAIDGYFPRISNWKEGSDHTLDASAVVALRGTAGASNKLLLDVPVEVPQDQTLALTGASGHPAKINVGNFCTVDVLSGGSLKVESGGSLLALAGSTVTISSTPTFAAGMTVSAGESAFKGMHSAEVTDSFSVSLTFDWALGNHHLVTMTNNTSFASTNQQNGGLYTVHVIQDGTGSRTISWGGAYVFGTISNAPKAAAGSNTVWLFKCTAGGLLLALSRNEV